jgi:hypothetical protein
MMPEPVLSQSFMCEYVLSVLPSSTIMASQSFSVCDTSDLRALGRSADLLYVVMMTVKNGW